MAVTIDSLFKKYPGADHYALNGITLHIPEGSIYGLLGPNGAGKTTTINILSGIARFDSGSVTILGADITKNRKIVKNLCGIVPQNIAMFPNLTLSENLVYFGNIQGLKGASLRKRITELTIAFGLDKHTGKTIKQFSGGMQRRANIISSLLHHPRVLILDEPTAGVDVQSRYMIHDFLKAYQKEGNTIIYTSHLLDEAQILCTHAAIIDHGRIVTHGSMSDLVSNVDAHSGLTSLFLALTGEKTRD